MTVENIKTANAGMALLMGSSDELSGEVAVIDPATQVQLGSFYVQVVNSHGGLAGLAMRGGGIREKLVEEFALESSRILTDSTKKDWKKRVKAADKAADAARLRVGGMAAALLAMLLAGPANARTVEYLTDMAAIDAAAEDQGQPLRWKPLLLRTIR